MFVYLHPFCPLVFLVHPLNRDANRRIRISANRSTPNSMCDVINAISFVDFKHPRSLTTEDNFPTESFKTKNRDANRRIRISANRSTPNSMCDVILNAISFVDFKHPRSLTTQDTFPTESFKWVFLLHPLKPTKCETNIH